MKKFALLLITLFIFQIGLSAQKPIETEHTNIFGGSLEVGAFGLVEQNAYKGTSSNYEAYPLIKYKYKNLTLAFPTSEYEIELSEYFVLKPKVIYRFEGFDEDDSTYLNGMESPKETFEAGLELEYINPNFTLALEGTHDILDRHKGGVIALTLSKNYFKDTWLFRPYTTAEIYSDNVIDYYYGVSSSEVKSDRPAYKGEATGIYLVGLFLSKRITKRITGVSIISQEWFGSGIKNSPITDRTTRFRIFLGFSYLI